MLKYYDSHIEGGGSLTIAKRERYGHRNNTTDYPEHYKELAKFTYDISDVKFINDDKDEYILKSFMTINTRSFIVLKDVIIVIDERENILIGFDNYIISLVNSMHYNQLGYMHNHALFNYLEYIFGNCQPVDDISHRKIIKLKQRFDEKSSEAVES